MVAVASAVITLLRAFPFLVMSRKDLAGPRMRAVEKWLSPAIIAMLVVYSYSTLEWRLPHPYVAGIVTILFQLKWHNGLVSIFAGTAVYMALVNFAPLF